MSMKAALRGTGRLWRRIRTCWRLPSFHAHDRSVADREIAVNRVLIGCGAAAYGLFLTATGRLESDATLALNVAYLAVAAVVLARCLRGSGLSSVGRLSLLGFDVGVLSATFMTAGRFAGPAYLLYIWLILGYGFRHGIRYLRTASLLSLMGFGAMVAASRHWSEQPHLVAGLVGTLLVIPLYVELLLRKLIREMERAQDANHAKALMLAGLGHELRTPLAVIAGVADRLSRTRLDLEQAEMVASVRTAARSLSAELDSFLDVSRLEAGKMSVSAAAFSVLEATREALRLVAGEARAKGLLLGWHVTTRVPSHVRMDRRHLLKIMTNLAMNAVRFTGAGSVLVTVDAGRDAAGSPTLRVEVSDTGIGIRHDAREKIFESFTQASPEILHIYGGAGLGLSVARQLVELHGGRIGVDSKPGKGSRFWFEIPAPPARPDPAPGDRPRRLGVVVLSQDTRGLHVFAERVARLGAKPFLVDRFERLNAAVSGDTGDFDRIVVVVDGRDVDAVEVAHTLRNAEALGRVPLVLLSAKPGLPPLAVRRHYVTSIGVASSDEDISAALRLAGSRGELEMEQDPDRVPSATAAAPVPADGALRVLVADDSLSNRVVLKRMLEAAGHTCATVENGEQVLVAVADGSYDAVLMDTDMPAMDGYDAAQTVRFIGAGFERLPIVGMTDEATPETARRCAEAGMARFLVRPINPEALLSALREVAPDRGKDASQTAPTGASVAPIASHPLYRPGLGPPLKDAGFAHFGVPLGPDFAAEVARAFLSDAARISAKLDAAMAQGDGAVFRGQLRALRGCASTIGASRLEELCASGKELDGAVLDTKGRVLLRQVKDEVGRVRQELEGPR